MSKIVIKYMVLNNEAKIACEQNLLKIEFLVKSVKKKKRQVTALENPCICKMGQKLNLGRIVRKLDIK